MSTTLAPNRRETGPVRPDHTIDQNWAAYTPEEHGRWDRLYARMTELLPGRACAEFLAGLDRLTLSERGIPDMERLSDRLERITGWRVVAVPGLVPDAVFFDHLANRRFPAGAFLRAEHEFDYIEEPDIFHDIFGHVPLLSHPPYADFVEAYGKGGHRALALGALPALARLYWYTIEFGLIEEAGALRLFGAGIMSSPKETVFALDDPSPNRIAFDLRRIMATAYRIDDFQQSYFVIDGFESLLAATAEDFGPIYRAFPGQSPHAPEAVLPADTVIHRGTQAYFRAKARPAP
jgi:phenylalanine-4-hydroxylase